VNRRGDPAMPGMMIAVPHIGLLPSGDRLLTLPLSTEARP
jgi:hypothetical protein